MQETLVSLGKLYGLCATPKGLIGCSLDLPYLRSKPDYQIQTDFHIGLWLRSTTYRTHARAERASTSRAPCRVTTRAEAASKLQTNPVKTVERDGAGVVLARRLLG